MAAPDLTVILARTLTLDPDRPEVQAVLVGAGSTDCP